MALANYRIYISKVSNNTGPHVGSLRFAARPADLPTEGNPRSGKILPKGKGFPVKCDLPGVDLKVVRSMISCGLKAEVDYVLRRKRRSIITPQYIWDGIMRFGDPPPPRPKNDELYTEILAELENQFDLDKKLRPLDFRTAATKIPQNTNPGFPYINLEPGLKKGEIIQKYLASMDAEWREIVKSRFYPLPDCAAYARSSICDPGVNKVRPVWTYPITVIIAESMFVTPLADMMKQQKIFRNTAFGMEMMCGGMTYLNGLAHHARILDPGCKYLMTDYSSFDARVPAWLIRDCFSIIRRKFDLSSDYGYYSNVFRRIESYFINTPIRNADGRRFLKDHGIPSGTMFTNIMGTMCNFVISRYLVRATTGQGPIFDIYFGDDALICVPGSSKINMDNIAFQALRTFGSIISSKKSYWTTKIYNIHFLGYYNAMGSPYKTDLELFASMVYPQYSMDSWPYALARSLGCVCASAGQNNAVFMTAQMVMKRTAEQTGQLDEAQKIIRENPRITRFFGVMGVDPSWVTIGILRDISLTQPTMNCTKLEMGIDLCSGWKRGVT